VGTKFHIVGVSFTHTLDLVGKGGQVVTGSMAEARDQALPSAQGGTQAVDRAASLLTYVVEADHPVTFAEVTEASGLARSTTSRLLAALENNRLIERSAAGEYVGGPLFVLYAARHDPHAELARLAHPMLEAIGDSTGETVHLAVPNRGQVAHIDQVDSTFLLVARDWTGVEVPTHCSALGKVLLAWGVLPRPSGRLDRMTDRTLRTAPELDADLARVRERGFAVTCDELEVGLAGVAVPLMGPDDNVIATVGISGPTARLEDRVDQIGRLLKDQTKGLSELLRRGTHTEVVA
jgi:IclR family acetate operon transcriptional repressor